MHWPFFLDKTEERTLKKKTKNKTKKKNKTENKVLTKKFFKNVEKETIDTTRTAKVMADSISPDTSFELTLDPVSRLKEKGPHVAVKKKKKRVECRAREIAKNEAN